MEQLHKEQHDNSKTIGSVLKFTGQITLTFLLSLITIYWHGQYITATHTVPHYTLTTSGFYRIHLAVSQLLGVSYLFCLVASVITILSAFFLQVAAKLKQPLFFNILTHLSLFLYLTYSGFLDWAID
jgi:hypothetical protein